MRGGHHRMGSSRMSSPGLPALPEHCGETGGQVLLDAAHVQEKAGRAAVQHFLHHGLGHHVARGQIAAFVVAEHEGPAFFVQQTRAFAAHGLGDQGR